MSDETLRAKIEALVTKPAEVAGMPEPWKSKTEKALREVQDYLREALAAPSPSPSSAPGPCDLQVVMQVCPGCRAAFAMTSLHVCPGYRFDPAPASPQPTGARLPSGRLAEPDALREIRRRYTGHGVIHALAALLDAANNLAPEDDPDKYDGWRRLVVSARAEYDELWKVAASPQGERCDRCDGSTLVVNDAGEPDDCRHCKNGRSPQGERERAMEEALRHVFYRNHEFSRGCSGCSGAARLLSCTNP